MGGLTPAELARIRGRLEAFAADAFASLPRADQRARGQCYLRGLMLDGRRKSIEPMAQRVGCVNAFTQLMEHSDGRHRADYIQVPCGARKS